MQILDDLYAETRRLFIAGSKFAKDDPRILKYIPPLEKMGQKAPVMKKLAEKYTELTKDGQPEALAEAGAFLYAVMATQGLTEISGKAAKPEAGINELPKTSMPYSRLKPVIDALTLSMPGRYEIIKSAFEEGLLNDFRIYGYIVSALDDKYSMLADYIYEFVIPYIGSPLIPYLLEQYDAKGKQADAMRISLLSELGYENTEALAFNAIAEGSVSVAAEAIKILGKNPENEEYLLTLAKDKKSEIREAALVGLISIDSATGKELMMKTLQGSKYKSAIAAAKLCKDSEYTNKILDIIKPHYEGLYEKEFKKDEFYKANNKFTELLSSLENKDEADVYKFYIQLLKDKKYNKKLSEYKANAYLIHDIQEGVCRLLHRCPPEKMLMVCDKAMSVQIAKKAPDTVRYYYNIAKKNYTDEHVFSIFSKYYEAGLIGFVELFCSNGLYPNEFKSREDMEKEYKRVRLNVNTYWKKLFIQKEDIYAMMVLLCEGDEYEKDMREVVIKAVKKQAAKKRADLTLGLAVGRLLEALNDKKTLWFKSELEKTAEACYELFEKTDGYYINYFYEGLGRENFLKLFNAEYIEKFKALAKKKASVIFKEIEEILLSQ